MDRLHISEYKNAIIAFMCIKRITYRFTALCAPILNYSYNLE